MIMAQQKSKCTDSLTDQNKYDVKRMIEEKITYLFKHIKPIRRLRSSDKKLKQMYIQIYII